MMFMAGASGVGETALLSASSEWRMERENHSLLAIRLLHSRHIELRLLAGAVAAQRAVLANRVGALKDPVLPRRQAREDFRFHGLGPDEAQVRFHAGETVGREAGALLEKHPDLVIPVDIVERKRDEAERLGPFGIDRLADFLLRAFQVQWIGLEARLQPRQPMAHRIRPKVHRG